MPAARRSSSCPYKVLLQLAAPARPISSHFSLPLILLHICFSFQSRSIEPSNGRQRLQVRLHRIADRPGILPTVTPITSAFAKAGRRFSHLPGLPKARQRSLMGRYRHSADARQSPPISRHAELPASRSRAGIVAGTFKRTTVTDITGQVYFLLS